MHSKTILKPIPLIWRAQKVHVRICAQDFQSFFPPHAKIVRMAEILRDARDEKFLWNSQHVGIQNVQNIILVPFINALLAFETLGGGECR